MYYSRIKRSVFIQSPKVCKVFKFVQYSVVLWRTCPCYYSLSLNIYLSFSLSLSLSLSPSLSLSLSLLSLSLSLSLTLSLSPYLYVSFSLHLSLRNLSLFVFPSLSISISFIFFSIFVFLLLLDSTDYMNQKLPAKNRKLVYVYTYLPHQNMLSLEIRIKNVSSRYVTIYRFSYVSTTVQKDK